MKFQEGIFFLRSLLLSLYSYLETLEWEKHIWNQLEEASETTEESTLHLNRRTRGKTLV